MERTLNENVPKADTKLHFNYSKFSLDRTGDIDWRMSANKGELATIAETLDEVLLYHPDDSKAIEDLRTLAGFLDVSVSEDDASNPRRILEAAKVVIEKMRSSEIERKD